jgi:hypothetical protein
MGGRSSAPRIVPVAKLPTEPAMPPPSRREPCGDVPAARCTVCNRSTLDTGQFGQLCGMPLAAPGVGTCAGRFNLGWLP